MLRKIGIIAVLSLILAAVAAVPALAVAPTSTTRDGGLHFVGEPDLTASLTRLTVTGEVAGAGSTGGTASLTADAVVTRGCITPSGSNEPRGLQRDVEPVAGAVEFDTTRRGRGSFTVRTAPITLEGFSCPSARMTPVILRVRYTNILLTVTSQTGTITARFPDQTVSR